MNPIAEIAVIAFPCILAIVGYLAHRMLDKIDSELSSMELSTKELSDRMANLRKDIYRIELKQDTVLKSGEIVQTQYVAMNNKMNEISTKLSTYSTDLSTIKDKQKSVDENYGKVIKIVQKVVDQLKK